MAEHQLPKLTVRVRFPSSALITNGQVGGEFPTLGYRSFWGPVALVSRLSADPAYATSSDRGLVAAPEVVGEIRVILHGCGCCRHLLFEVKYGA
jgi:hypothetical protein